MRATNRTKPLFVAALLDVAVFVVVMFPLTLTFGVTGYVIGFAHGVARADLRAHVLHAQAVRAASTSARHTWRAIAPAGPAGRRSCSASAPCRAARPSLACALAELALSWRRRAVSTYLFERRLIAELFGYLRGRRRSRPAPRARR